MQCAEFPVEVLGQRLPVEEHLDLVAVLGQHGEREPALAAKCRKLADDAYLVIGAHVGGETGVQGADLGHGPASGTVVATAG